MPGITLYYARLFYFMAYRFTNTDKWSDAWFTGLTANGMLLFNYLCDNCDTAGFYEVSMKKMRGDLPMTAEEIRTAFKDIELSFVCSRDKTVILLKNFVKHQKNLPLNHRNSFHKGIFSRIDLYKKKFSHDIVKLINQGMKPKQNNGDLKGQQQSLLSPYGNGNSSIYLFQDFWSLYDKKLGDRKKCETKWNSLTPQIQKRIIEILPKWKSQFSEKQYQPYPETFFNQERWNDEFVVAMTVKPLTIAM